VTTISGFAPAQQAESVEAMEDIAGEAAELISILADALERIAETTTDAAARSIAELAMAEFHGR
jgi:hypothetical protein